ncbi:uncharacterized protein LOC130665860 isoform X2 [Microplitis mediator]|uniref:uncharacterized protein LOC130665860 isoform X2 n=1 Tax=Microplitis mediator TaxID=375433 RepID=UPI002552EEAD|nr:uncharacterized protein LOC130665860 isoform X2 [Microplitis mediator]
MSTLKAPTDRSPAAYVQSLESVGAKANIKRSWLMSVFLIFYKYISIWQQRSTNFALKLQQIKVNNLDIKMNNLIMKLRITLVIFSTILFVDSHSINKRSSPTEGMIIGPDTPVYYLEYPYDDYLKVNFLLNKFEASPSYNYYRNPKNKSNGTLFVKVLVVEDWDSGLDHRTEENILEEVLTKWNKVDKYFEQLDNPKIKLAIAGVVIPTKSHIWGTTIVTETIIWPENNDTFTITSNTYQLPSYLNNMTKWFNDNGDRFEGLNYDFFIVVSRWKLVLSNDAKLFSTYSSMSFVCDTKNSPNYHSVGGIVYNNRNFIQNTAYTIARILGVNADQILGCESGHIMDWSGNHIDGTWSECSKRFFRSMVNSSAYTCLHQIPYDQDEDDYS